MERGNIIFGIFGILLNVGFAAVWFIGLSFAGMAGPVGLGWLLLMLFGPIWVVFLTIFYLLKRERFPRILFLILPVLVFVLYFVPLLFRI